VCLVARRILVTGSRGWTGARLEQRMRDRFDMEHSLDVTLVHGDAYGADRMAASLGRVRGWTVESHPADWDTLGSGAGPARNQLMLDLGADVLWAFWIPPSPGTLDMINRALPVITCEIIYGTDRSGS
jgi:hypothetical protein